MANSMYESQDLYLDPSIRYWVLFPIMAVMFLVGILRHNITQLISTDQKATLKDIKENLALNYGRQLINKRNYLPEYSFKMRKTYWIEAYSKGKYLKNPNGSDPSDMLDPGNMESAISGVKKSFVSIIPQTILMSWVSYFFSGFVIIKLPFALPYRFKTMLQRGINTSNLDITWVSSISWYFLNLFGLNGIFSLILGKNNAAGGAKDIAPQIQQPNAKDKFNKLHKSIGEELEITEHDWLLENVEDKILIKYGKKEKEAITKKSK